MRLAASLLLLSALPAIAQFSQFAATDDGAQLYFTTQYALKTAAGGPSESRLYRFGPDGVTLFAERGALAASDLRSGVAFPSVSGDGSLVAFTLMNVCPAGPNCTQAADEAMLRGRQNLDLGPGTVRLSRNGRWAVLTNLVTVQCPPEIGGGAPVGCLSFAATLIDLSTGQRTLLPPGAGGIASDGTVTVLAGLNIPSVSLWKQGKTTPLTLPPGMLLAPADLSDDASTLIGYTFRSARERPDRLVAINITWSTQTVIFQAKNPTRTPLFLASSNNGQRVLYVDADVDTYTGPAYVWDAATGTSIPIPLPDGELVTDGTLSGRGEFAFVSTTRRRIVKFPVRPGTEAVSLFAAPPYCEDPGTVAGGSLARLHCSFAASLSQLQGHVLYNGQPMPVLYSNAAEIGVQIPWEWNKAPQAVLSFDFPDASPFRSRQFLNVAEATPQFLPADPAEGSLFGIKIVKGDWSGFVTRQPRPGDLVYIYMTGLGPVTGPMETGVPASLTTPNPMQGGIACRFQPDEDYIPALWVGLAPGAVGIYQTAFNIPPGAGPVPVTQISCVWYSPTGGGEFGTSQ